IAVQHYNRILLKFQIWLVKFDFKGDTLWTKRYAYNHWNEVYQCKQTPDKGFVIVGASDSTDFGYADMTLIKTDSLGNMEWQKFYHKTGTERAMSMDLMDDKGYVIGGWRDNINFTAELIRTDSIGNIKWSNAYGSSYGGYGAAIKKTLNGDYLIGYCTGVSNNGGLDIFYQITLKRLNNNNQTLWTKTYGHLIYNGGSYTILEDENGDITFVGAFADSATQHVLSYIIKTDSSGNQKYMRLYDHLTAVNDQNYLYDIKATNDKGFIATGFCAGSGSPQYCWVVKVDSVGCQFPGCNVGVSEAYQFSNRKFLIYPNPANNEITLKFEKSFEKDAIVTVFNSIGESVITQNIFKTDSDVLIDIARLQAGIYLVKICSYTGKFVKE
ncbi:MAG: T9SS type A sorting domain-containing protein, partial [Bacteroidota bacterium]